MSGHFDEEFLLCQVVLTRTLCCGAVEAAALGCVDRCQNVSPSRRGSVGRLPSLSHLHLTLRFVVITFVFCH